MRTRRGQQLGLAEVVGTLMLVVIVVAAATAFSFFVASYQKQVQSEEALNHDKNLENLRIFDLIPKVGSVPPQLSALRIDIASLDVNPIGVESITLNGYALVAYNVTDTAGTILGTGCLNGNPFVPPDTNCVLIIPAESQVFLDFDLNDSSSYYAFGSVSVNLTESGLFAFDVFTSRGNEFVQSFVPPVAIAGVTFVDSYAILDGTNSYQPNINASVTVTIDQWRWNVTAPVRANDTGNYSGQEVELPRPITLGVPYTIDLNVTNSESLIGSTQIVYTAV